MSESRRGGGGGRQTHVKLRTARGRRTSSQRWLQRQLNDPYVAAAQRSHYRSRAAFKLSEIDDRYRVIRKGMTVLDLGAAPGGWSQVALERAGKGARVVAADLQEIEPIPGVEILQMDVFAEGATAELRGALGGLADLVLSDMAPSTTGHQRTDQLRILALAERAWDVAQDLLAPGGAYVVKLFQGGAHRELLEMLKRDFEMVRHVKPPASRKDSSEIYLIATGYRAR